MSRNRRNPHLAKVRRERIRQEKQSKPAEGGESSGNPFVDHPFFMERSLRGVEALLEGQKFDSVEEINAKLAELNAGGRISETADAWKADDPKWRAQQLAYDALESDSVVEALRLASEAVKLDPDCIDAHRLMISVAAPDAENKLHLMRELVETAERNFGGKFMQENMGHFWEEVSTRPYMRAKLHLGELLEETGNVEEAIAVFERMMELSEGDNLGARYKLASLYLVGVRLKELRRLMKRSRHEEKYLAMFGWVRVMERWLSGKPEAAAEAMARTNERNPFVASYAAGLRKLPREIPPMFTPGEQTEAVTAAYELRKAFRAHPAFREWVRAQKRLM